MLSTTFSGILDQKVLKCVLILHLYFWVSFLALSLFLSSVSAVFLPCLPSLYLCLLGSVWVFLLVCFSVSSFLSLSLVTLSGSLCPLVSVCR